MIIKSITPGDLRHMQDQEALILQGCGGDLTEWVEGINGILAEEEILKDGFRFEEAYTFKNEGLTCLMFPLEDGSKINMGKLALWRIGTHHNFGGTWLSDYVENRLGGFAREYLRILPAVRSLRSASGTVLSMVAGNRDRSRRCRTSGMVGKPLFDCR